MKYKLNGSLEIRIPEGHGISVDAENKDEAICKLLELISEGEVEVSIVKDYLKFKKERKVFYVYVEETFRNCVEIDTDEYPDINNEDEAYEYVERNLDDFNMDFCYDYTTSTDNTEVTCESWDTETYEDEDDD